MGMFLLLFVVPMFVIVFLQYTLTALFPQSDAEDSLSDTDVPYHPKVDAADAIVDSRTSVISREEHRKEERSAIPKKVALMEEDPNTVFAVPADFDIDEYRSARE